jgi:hypothetical protein
MAARWLGILVVALVATPLGARAQDARLVLSNEDVSQVRSFTANLKKAAVKGPAQTRAFLDAKATNAPLMKQRLQNVSVAYTALKVEEQIEELRRLGLDKDPSSEYAQRIAETRKDLEEMTAAHRAAKASDGRTALEVNKTIVRSNLAAVEQLMANVRDVNPESLPR